MKNDLPEALKKNWKTLLKEGQTLTFRKGQVLAYEGHHPYGIFVLKSGQVEFSREGVTLPEGPLLEAVEGNLIGLNCLMEAGVCCCTCRAAEDCQIIFIPKSLLMPYLGEITENGGFLKKEG